MPIVDSILESVGRTPLVRLGRLSSGLDITLLGKVEACNPGGSVKDRIALAMVEDAEERGLLRPGGTIVEATAGNTGAGLAMVAARRGYRCVFVLPDKMSRDKADLLRAYGAEVVVTRTDVPPESPMSYNRVADRLSREIPGAWRPNQFGNPANPAVHYRSTGPELWGDAGGRIDVFVAGVGTGGTISGVGRYLKERDPEVRVVGADPEGSVLSGGAPGSWKVEGIGEDFFPANFDTRVVDEWVRVTDAESFAAARRLAREEGILAGGSAGAALAAALRVAPRLREGSVVVALLPDTGRNYLSKLHSDEWMSENGFLEPADGPVLAGEVLTAKRALDGRAFVRLPSEGRDPRGETAEDVMGEPLPQLDESAPVGEVTRLLLAGHPGVVVTREGVALGLVNAGDLMEFWSERETAERGRA